MNDINFEKVTNDEISYELPVLRYGTNNELINISHESNYSDASFTSDFDEALAIDTSLLNLACTNARSLVHKIDSLVTLFDENGLHFAALTETWLTAKHCSPRTMADLTIGANLSFIRRDRGSRGGGVAICYNRQKYVCAVLISLSRTQGEKLRLFVLPVIVV